MALSRLAPLAALSAVVGGTGLLGASLGGIVSVDRDLASAASAGAGAQRGAAPAGAGARRGASWSARDRRSSLRVLRLTDDQGVRSLVIVVDRREAAGRAGRRSHRRPEI